VQGFVQVGIVVVSARNRCWIKLMMLKLITKVQQRTSSRNQSQAMNLA